MQNYALWLVIIPFTIEKEDHTWNTQNWETPTLKSQESA